MPVLLCLLKDVLHMEKEVSIQALGFLDVHRLPFLCVLSEEREDHLSFLVKSSNPIELKEEKILACL
jgi:hypothetical protein